MSSQLVSVEKKNIMQVFTDEKGLDPYVKMIKEKVKNHKYDVSTKKGRDEITSLAHNVAKSKVYLDDLGKDLVSGWKKQSKKVDEARKAMRDELIALKDEARQPLTDWEAEAAEKERIFQEKAAALKLKEQAESDHEMGLLMNEKIDREIAEQERLNAEAEENRLTEELRIQKEHDEKIAKEAAEESERKAKQAEQDKISAQERAARLEAEAEKKRLQDIEDEKQRQINAKRQKEEEAERTKQAKIESDLQAEKLVQRARQCEIQRQEDEKLAQEEAQRKIENNKKRVGSVRREIKEHLIFSCKIDEPLAKEIVLALLKTERVKINY
jgi:hypothetical protein